MKQIRMGLMAIAALTGIGGAFASSSRAHQSGTTYYASKSGASFVWRTTPPADQSCQPTAQNAACTIVTNNVPTDGIIPAGHSSTAQLYQPN